MSGRAREAEIFVLTCLTYRGPLTVQDIADLGGVDDWGFGVAERFRSAMHRLERAGEVRRHDRVPSGRRGPWPWRWTLAASASTDGRTDDA